MSSRERNPDNKPTTLTSWPLLLWHSLTFIGLRVKNALRPFLAPAVILAALGIAIYLVWLAALAAPDSNLHLTFLDVGSTDAVLIQTPGGRRVLVDGGTSPSRRSSALGQRLQLIDRRLDRGTGGGGPAALHGPLPRCGRPVGRADRRLQCGGAAGWLAFCEQHPAHACL
jgi:hypothetical protein